MACDTVTLPGGARAIICGTRRRPRCACGRPASLLCDWKVREKRGTCDKPICTTCTTSPADGKDLCRKHAAVFEEWKATRARGRDEEARI